MAAYQQAGDAQKTIDTANRILQVNPNNVRALALLAYNYRAAASQGGPQTAAEHRSWRSNTGSRDCRRCTT